MRKFDTVLIHLNWRNPRRKYLNKIPTAIKADFGNRQGRHFPCATSRAQKSSQKVRTCAAGDGAICSKKLEKLSHIMGTALKLEMARGYGLRIRFGSRLLFTHSTFLKKDIYSNCFKHGRNCADQFQHRQRENREGDICREKKIEIWLNLSNKARSVFSMQISITYV